MKTIRVSGATYRAIAAQATLPFCSDGRCQADGRWLMSLDDDTYTRLEAHRLPNETYDDIIARLIRGYRGQPLN